MIRHALTEESKRVMVYGTAWSEETTHIRRLLTQWGVSYHYIDIDSDEYARAKVARWNLGEACVPVVSCGPLENPRLITPSDQQLHGMLYTCDEIRVGPLLL